VATRPSGLIFGLLPAEEALMIRNRIKGTMDEWRHDEGSPIGARGVFKTTRWTRVHKACQEDSPSGRLALSGLCQDYWYPLYAFARRRGHSKEDSQDLTQGFFARLFEKDYLKRADAARGRFRTFLLSSFTHYLINDWEKNQAGIRGGKCSFVSWEGELAEERYGQEPSHELSPEKLYDQRWALILIEKTMAALRQEHTRAGEQALFEALQGHLTGGEGLESYKAAAARLHLTESAVKMRVHRLKRRFGILLREQIADTVSQEKEIDEEMRQLFAAWG
jgi:RNA polymerase sigma factor (sigma-70 family)